MPWALSGGKTVGRHTPAATAPGGTGPVAHGSELTINHVGPWTLQGVAKGSETLAAQLTTEQKAERLSTWPTDGRPSWILGTEYVYNNDPANLGGIVPAGGMTIDGYAIPAGTWVVQFRDLSSGIGYIQGDCSGSAAAWPGVVFRGCRMRGGYTAPGWYNQNGQSHGGIIWIMYADAGGRSLAVGDYCESIFESQNWVNGRDRYYVIRSYLSNAATLSFGRNSGDGWIENFGHGVSDFGDNTKHLNGLANSGGQSCNLWLRNHLVFPQEAGSTNQTNVFQMAADAPGLYHGGGTNLDGSTGYNMEDNYLGGAAYVLQLGFDKTNTVDDVRDVHVTGNKITTSIYANGGLAGVAYKTPNFTLWGNTWTGNTWADGPNAGQTIAAPGPSNA